MTKLLIVSFIFVPIFQPATSWLDQQQKGGSWKIGNKSMAFGEY
jgi:hypothetical protein